MTARDQEILDTLTHKVRVLSRKQIGERWWAGPSGERNAAKRLKILAENGLVTIFSALAHPRLELTAPVVKWTPKDPRPNFGAVSFRLRSRWTTSCVLTSAVIATHAAAAREGGWGGRKPRASELSHDICLSEVFLRLREENPIRAGAWLSEARLYGEEGQGRNDRLPDALIISRAEKTVIEFGGEYPKRKVEEFHRYCEARSWSYELW